MISEFIDKADEDEVGVLLNFGKRLPKVAARTHKASLTEVKLEGNPAGAVADLLPDPRGRYVVAVSAGADHYHVVHTGGKGVKADKVSAPGKLTWQSTIVVKALARQ